MAPPATMKALIYSQTDGGLEKNLELATIPVPKPPSFSPKKPCILVSVSSASLNPADYKVPEKTLIGRLITRRPATPCLDFAGRLVEIPPGGAAALPAIQDLKPGDRVFGRLDFLYQRGVLSEYTLAQASGLVRLPDSLSFAEGAAIGTAGITAYQALEPYVKPGDRVFVNGGSGGVGTFTIQIAKMLGASHVTVACSGANAELCRGLGADEIIDYKSVDVAQQLKVQVEKEGKLFDHVVDNVPEANALYEASPSYLSEKGTYVQVTGTDDTVKGVWIMATRFLWPAWLGGVNRGWTILMAKNDPKALELIRDWVESGKVKVVIDSEYSFEEAGQAFAKLRTGRARGKLVVNIAQ